jgi:hypothetical protein
VLAARQDGAAAGPAPGAPEASPAPPDSAPTIPSVPGVTYELLEEDTPLSFSGVWGPAAATPPPRSRAPVHAEVVAPPAARPGPALAWLAAGAVALMVVAGLAGVESWNAAVRPLAASPPPVTRPGGNALAATAPPRAPVPGMADSGRPRDSARNGHGDPGPISPSLAAHLGPVGGSVDLEAQVVGSSFGRLILRHGGRHYMVVRGRIPPDARPGDKMKLVGWLLGSSRDGMMYVEVAGP